MSQATSYSKAEASPGLYSCRAESIPDQCGCVGRMGGRDEVVESKVIVPVASQSLQSYHLMARYCNSDLDLMARCCEFFVQLFE